MRLKKTKTARKTVREQEGKEKRSLGRSRKPPFKRGELIRKIFLAVGVGVAIGAVMVMPPLAITFEAILKALRERG